MLNTPISLLERLCNSQAEEAWHRFVDIYTPLLMHWARRMKVRNCDIGDLLQDSFLHLFKVMPHFKNNRKGHFHGWLHSVFRNYTIDWIRKQPGKHAADEMLSQIAVDQQNDLTETEYRQYVTERALCLMKNNFPEETWRACWLSIMEDMPVEAIAQQLGITVNMVYLAKSRVLKQLRLEMQFLIE